MKIEVLALLLAIVDTCCWIVCFWWMHRISVRQENTLEELHTMTKRIEKLAEAEHDLIKEVHPVVEKIHNSVANVEDAVATADPSRK